MVQMRIVYLVLACCVSGAIGAGGALYYVRNVPCPVASAAAAPAPGANQTSPSRLCAPSRGMKRTPTKSRKLATCNNSPGTAMHDPECYNAESAKEHSDIDHFIESAPKDAQPVVPNRNSEDAANASVWSFCLWRSTRRSIETTSLPVSACSWRCYALLLSAAVRARF